MITGETDLFEHREVKSHFINPCCFGEDFAIWLKEQISSLMGLGFSFSDAIQEDYGLRGLGKEGQRFISG
jgi:hypothetical protein